MSSSTIPVVEQITSAPLLEPFPNRLNILLLRICSFPAMLVAALSFLVTWVCMNRLDDPDLWWHLKLGETIWTTHQIPKVDHFSFTANGSGWLAHEWLPQVLLYGIYHMGGLVALQIALCVFASIIIGLSYLLCSLWSRNWKVSFLGGIGALFFLTVSLAIRPLLAGHFFLLVELLLLYMGLVGDQVGARRKWLMAALPVLFILWANSHGSFLFGLVVLAGSLTARFLRKEGWRLRLEGQQRDWMPWGAVLLLCFLAPLVNPVGPMLAVYPIDVLFFQPDNTGSIAEWAPLSLFQARGIGLIAVVGYLVAMVMVFRRKLYLGEWIALGLTTAMALQHSRMLPIFGFIALPIACRMLADDWDNYDPKRDFPVANAVLIAAALVFSYLIIPKLPAIEEQVALQEPVAAVAALQKAGWPGPLLNEYVWGGYLMWANPSQPVFIDGRTDIYAWNGVLRKYGRWALLQDDPLELLDHYRIRTVLLRAEAPMAHVLPHLAGWKQVYTDKLAVVFTRDAVPVSAASRN